MLSYFDSSIKQIVLLNLSQSAGCQKKGKRDWILYHEELDCEFMEIRCQFEGCTKSFLVNKVDEHLNKSHNTSTSHTLIMAEKWDKSVCLTRQESESLAHVKAFGETFILVDVIKDGKLHVFVWILGTLEKVPQEAAILILLKVYISSMTYLFI